MITGTSFCPSSSVGSKETVLTLDSEDRLELVRVLSLDEDSSETSDDLEKTSDEKNKAKHRTCMRMLPPEEKRSHEKPLRAFKMLVKLQRS